MDDVLAISCFTLLLGATFNKSGDITMLVNLIFHIFETELISKDPPWTPGGSGGSPLGPWMGSSCSSLSSGAQSKVDTADKFSEATKCDFLAFSCAWSYWLVVPSWHWWEVT